MNQIPSLAALMFCALFAFSPSLQAMGSKKISSAARDIASERDIASVEHESKGVPQLITYDELKKLSPERRAEYISGVRALIVKLAAKNGKDFPMFAGGKSLKETYSLLEALLPEANAQYQNTRTTPEDILPRYERRQYVNNMEKWTCDSSKAEFNYSVGTCVQNGGKKDTLLKPCDRGYVAAYLKNSWLARSIGSPSSKYCVPSASWEVLSPKRKRELANSDGADSAASYFVTRLDGGRENTIGAQVALGGTKKVSRVPAHLAVPVKDELRGGDYDCLSSSSSVKYDADLGTCGAAVSKSAKCSNSSWKKVYVVKAGWTEAQRKFFCVTPASWNLLSEKRQSALEYPVGPNAASAVDREQAATGVGRRSYAAARVTLPPERSAATIDAPNDNPETAVVERSPSEDIAQGGAPCSGITQVTCADSSKKPEKRAAALEWWKKNENTCIFAGNASSFSTDDYKDKTCQAVTSFSKPELNCSEGVICNPIIFGAQADGKPYCSTNYSEATADCNSLAGEKGSSEWLDKNISSIKNEWNKLREGMSQSCGRNAVREYFCEECNIMMERLASLRVLAVDRGEDGICHAPLMSYEQKTATPSDGSEQKAAQ